MDSTHQNPLQQHLPLHSKPSAIDLVHQLCCTQKCPSRDQAFLHTLHKEEYTTIENHTLLKNIDNLMYPTQLNFSDDTPNQILHILSTLILWSKLSTVLVASILPYTISWLSHPKTYLIGNTTYKDMFFSPLSRLAHDRTFFV